MGEFERTLKGYRLTTAKILYRFPDYPDLLQIYIWQNLDLAPKFPVLGRFLDHWRNELEGPIHSVRVYVGNRLDGNSNSRTEYIL